MAYKLIQSQIYKQIKLIVKLKNNNKLYLNTDN